METPTDAVHCEAFLQNIKLSGGICVICVPLYNNRAIHSNCAGEGDQFELRHSLQILKHCISIDISITLLCNRTRSARVLKLSLIVGVKKSNGTCLLMASAVDPSKFEHLQVIRRAFPLVKKDLLTAPILRLLVCESTPSVPVLTTGIAHLPTQPIIVRDPCAFHSKDATKSLVPPLFLETV